MLAHFKKTDDLTVIMSQDRVDSYLDGSDPLPGINTVRPWTKKPAMRNWAARAIAFLQKWAATPGSAGTNERYLPKEHPTYFVEIEEETEQSIRDAAIADETMYTRFLNLIYSHDYAAHHYLQWFAGLRPAEINAFDSKLELGRRRFWVGTSCKTGNRYVYLPHNLILILKQLKREGRLNYKTTKVAWTWWHVKAGFEGPIGAPGHMYGDEAATLEFERRFRERYPLGFYERYDGQDEDDELEAYGEWTIKLPRHTCLSFFYAASLSNSGATAGYAGHRVGQFFDAYHGKLHLRKGQDEYDACYHWYTFLPERMAAIPKDKIEIPLWFILKKGNGVDQDEIDNALLDLIVKA
jgi:hypothetical protein